MAYVQNTWQIGTRFGSTLRCIFLENLHDAVEPSEGHTTVIYSVASLPTESDIALGHANNVRWGRPNCPDADIWNAIFVRRLFRNTIYVTRWVDGRPEEIYVVANSGTFSPNPGYRVLDGTNRAVYSNGRP